MSLSSPTASAAAVPYWRLSSFYLVYFTVTGAFVPYWSVYLKALGYGAVAIGALMALPMATKVFAPYLWGWLADRTGRRVGVIQLATLLAGIALAGVALGHGVWWLAVVVTAFSFFWNAALPQFEAVTLSHLRHRGEHYYSLVRLWGSIGFILSALCLGWLFDWLSITWLPAILVGLLAWLWIASLGVPAPVATGTVVGDHSLGAVVRQPAVLALLAVCFLMQASHGPYYSFFTLYLRENGYGSGITGVLWSLGVLAEVGVFLLMHRLLPRFGARRLLLFATLVTAVRWVLIAGWVRDLPLLVFGQTLHAASYGIYHAAAISLIHKHFPGRLQGRGQALYSSVSFGLGGAFGSIVSGYVWSGLGPADTYLVGAGFALLGAAIGYWGLPAPAVRAPY
ncbi:MFS transporter [Acidihalobacter yilgarnensis]|uniref:MFS transporter n=1 Tax=Acidihalobacter yilgarnensis TaxID=2819280 RepID=A0A1D8ILY3_9GAMM|nr:MFS transporter [Acidihalobacter yilgarnensis]AOU97475.1 MFS transporter [Acidihalobacter yilgarnensis]